MMQRLLRAIMSQSFLILVLHTVCSGTVNAQWTTDGSPLCAAPNEQGGSVITTDGAGGAIVCWVDSRSGAADVYTQCIATTGAVLWTDNGVPMCTAPGHQFDVAVASDGFGGAIVVWVDERTGEKEDDIYVQRVSATGLVLWATNGVPICTAPGEQRGPAILADGEGGAIVVWDDARNGTENTDIYIQRVEAAGNVLWTPDGMALCASPFRQIHPVIVSDESGGVIVVWEDGRAGYEDGDLFAQRLTALGEALWDPNGVPVCEYGTVQTATSIVPDGSGGAIIAWVDYFGIQWEQSDIYAQRINASGEIQWGERGVALSNTFFYDQGAVVLTPDGVGGAIAAWHDWGGNGMDVFAQRIDPAGNPLWALNGVPVCSTPGEQYYPAIARDGVGGAIIAWQDDAPGLNYSDVRAGRIDPLGTVLWGSQGVPVSTAPNDQQRPEIVSDEGGGAIVVWSDGRNKTASSYDVYAQRIGPEGLVPTAVRGDDRAPGLFVGPPTPNPFSTTTSVDLHLADESVVNVRIYDVRGRLVRQTPLGLLLAGTHPVHFDGRDDAGDLLPSGVYFFRVTANGESEMRKIVIAR